MKTAPTEAQIQELKKYIPMVLKDWTLEKILNAEKSTMETLKKDEVLFNTILANIKA